MLQLRNSSVELVATSDVGPRVMRFAFVGGENALCELPDTLGKTGGTEWRNYGGHRLWHAPESQPRTYHPDNVPVHVQALENGIRLTQPTEPTTGIQKSCSELLTRMRRRPRCTTALPTRTYGP